MPSTDDSLFGLSLDELRSLLSDIPVGLLVVTTAEPELVHMNHCARSLLGLPEPAAKSLAPQRLPADIAIIDGEEECRIHDWLGRQLAGRVQQSQQNISVVRADGRIVDLLANVGCLQPDDTDRAGCVISFTDVSGEQWLGRQLARRAAQQTLAAGFSNAILMRAEGSDRLGELAADTVARGLNVEVAIFLEHDSDNDRLVVRSVAGPRAGDTRIESSDAPDSASDIVRAFRQRRTIAVENYEKSAAALRPLGLDELQAAIMTPVWRDGEPIGVLAGLALEPASFQSNDVSFVENVAHMTSSGMSRMAAEARYGDSIRRLERARATERLNRAARLTSLGTMASGIAHEVKNPINAIHMNAELAGLLLEEQKDLEQAAECLARIRSDCRRAAEIADGILSFARGSGSDDREKVNVGELFAGVSHLAASVPALSEVDLEFRIDDGEASLRVKRTELEQAIINLVQNSAEAGAASVTVDVRSRNSRLIVQVTDDGPGIPEGAESRLFDPFFTTRTRAGGSGLGLSLVHRIVADHGGQIDVENLPDRGCRFSISLPRET